MISSGRWYIFLLNELQSGWQSGTVVSKKAVGYILACNLWAIIGTSLCVLKLPATLQKHAWSHLEMTIACVSVSGCLSLWWSGDLSRVSPCLHPMTERLQLNTVTLSWTDGWMDGWVTKNSLAPGTLLVESLWSMIKEDRILHIFMNEANLPNCLNPHCVLHTWLPTTELNSFRLPLQTFF